MTSAALRARQRENTLRANGIPVKDWGKDSKLMALYGLEILEAKQEDPRARKVRQIEASNVSEAI